MLYRNLGEGWLVLKKGGLFEVVIWGREDLFWEVVDEFDIEVDVRENDFGRFVVYGEKGGVRMGMVEHDSRLIKMVGSKVMFGMLVDMGIVGFAEGNCEIWGDGWCYEKGYKVMDGIFVVGNKDWNTVLVVPRELGEWIKLDMVVGKKKGMEIVKDGGIGVFKVKDWSKVLNGMVEGIGMIVGMGEKEKGMLMDKLGYLVRNGFMMEDFGMKSMLSRISNVGFGSKEEIRVFRGYGFGEVLEDVAVDWEHDTGVWTVSLLFGDDYRAEQGLMFLKLVNVLGEEVLGIKDVLGNEDFVVSGDRVWIELDHGLRVVWEINGWVSVEMTELFVEDGLYARLFDGKVGDVVKSLVKYIEGECIDGMLFWSMADWDVEYEGLRGLIGNEMVIIEDGSNVWCYEKDSVMVELEREFGLLGERFGERLVSSRWW